MGSPAPATDLGQFTAPEGADVTINVNVTPESPVKDDVAPETEAAGDVEKGPDATTPAEDATAPEAA